MGLTLVTRCDTGWPVVGQAVALTGVAAGSTTAAVAGTVTAASSGGTITHGRQLNAGNTGPEAAGYTSLVEWPNSKDITVDGTVIEGYRFTNNGPSVYADNVVLRGCEFRNTGPNFWTIRNEGSNLLVEDCRFRPDDSDGPETTMAQSYQQGIKCFSTARGLTVRRSEFWGFGNAIEFEPEVSTQTQPLVVEDTWMHHAAAIDYSGSDEYHHDGILCSYAAGWVQVTRCRIGSRGNTNGLAFQSTGGQWHDCTITDSEFSGFGYTLNFGDSAGCTDFVFTGNDLATDFEPEYNAGPPNPLGNIVWSDNHWRVGAGSYAGANPAADGKFWWPGDGTTSAGHTTDYAG